MWGYYLLGIGYFFLLYSFSPVSKSYSGHNIALNHPVLGSRELWCFSESFPFLMTLTILRIQFSSVAQSCPTLCNPMNHSTPGLPIHHQLLEPTQTHVHWVRDAIQPSEALSSPSPSALNLSKHQGLFKWVSSSHQVAKVLEFQIQHQSFQWTPRTDL